MQANAMLCSRIFSLRQNSNNAHESGCTILCMLSQVQPYIDRSSAPPYSKDIEQNSRHTTRENCERESRKTL